MHTSKFQHKFTQDIKTVVSLQKQKNPNIKCILISCDRVALHNIPLSVRTEK